MAYLTKGMQLRELGKKTKTAKSKGITYWKKKAWKAFADYIKFRDAYENNKSNEYGYCVTCSKLIQLHTSDAQCGHFIPGRHPSILFDERGSHLQCYHCNVGLKGNWVPYEDYMTRKYGIEVVEELKQKDRNSKKFTPMELVGIRDKYNLLLKELNEKEKRHDV